MAQPRLSLLPTVNPALLQRQKPHHQRRSLGVSKQVHTGSESFRRNQRQQLKVSYVAHFFVALFVAAILVSDASALPLEKYLLADPVHSFNAVLPRAFHQLHKRSLEYNADPRLNLLSMKSQQDVMGEQTLPSVSLRLALPSEIEEYRQQKRRERLGITTTTNAPGEADDTSNRNNAAPATNKKFLKIRRQLATPRWICGLIHAVGCFGQY